MFRIVKTDEAKTVDEGSNSLFHSDKEDNINDDANPTEKEFKPDQVRMSGLSTQPTSKNDFDTLTADPTVVQQETESKSATQTHVEAGFNHKKSNIPAPPGGNVKTRTNIATIRYPQFYQHYLGFEHLKKVCLQHFAHFQTDKTHQEHHFAHQEYLQHFLPCCQEPR